jgi:flagellar biosynthesis protein FliR
MSKITDTNTINKMRAIAVDEYQLGCSSMNINYPIDIIVIGIQHNTSHASRYLALLLTFDLVSADSGSKLIDILLASYKAISSEHGFKVAHRVLQLIQHIESIEYKE